MSLTKTVIYRITERKKTGPQFVRGLGKSVEFDLFELDNEINCGDAELAIFLSGNAGESKATMILTLPDRKLWRIHRNRVRNLSMYGGFSGSQGVGSVEVRDVTDQKKSRKGHYEKILKRVAETVSREIGMDIQIDECS